ncbi:lysosomal alpha-mannosidase-like [Dermacentor andersoni]|uniref:lysosomal alpha-mannosidase-like n=1 Tax=Dermacentor andersoni TaxID=34620 RepID=UPI003B3B4D4D
MARLRLPWLIVALCAAVSCRWQSSRKHPTGSGCGFQSCPEMSRDYLNVHIICHSHLDAGWLDTVGNLFTSSVQHIYTSVRDSLMKYPQRRFVSAENVFFSRWMTLQKAHQAKESVHELVRAGRLQFVGGGWTQNDEAVTHYTAIVDQMTMGLRYLNDTFGECGGVKVGWQIDPFGHSKGFATLLAEMGYDCLVVSRVHHALLKHWRDTKRLEFVWKPQAELGSSHDMFTILMYSGTYIAPSEFCVQDYYCSVYDSQSGVARMAEDVLKLVFKQSAAFATNNVAIYIGGDLAFQNAERWFNQVDASIKAVNDVARRKGHRVRAAYSTPLCYLGALHASNRSWPVHRGDLLPYADIAGRTWVGYYSSRPNLKEYARYANGFLQACKQLAVLGGMKDVSLTMRLKDAVAILQHHDAITGTSKAAVASDYSRLLSAGIAKCETAMSRAMNQLMDPSGAAGDLPWRFCHALNVSECGHSEKLDLAETDGEFTLLLYNPSSTALSTYARLPVAAGLTFTVQGPQGDEVDTQAVPLIMTLLNIPERSSAARTELAFPVQLPPLGYAAYRIAAQKSSETGTAMAMWHRTKNRSVALRHERERGACSHSLAKTCRQMFRPVSCHLSTCEINVPQSHVSTLIRCTVTKLPRALSEKEEMHFASASLEFLLLEPEQRFIENERYRIELDTTSGLVRRVTLLGQESGVSLRQSFYAYAVDGTRRQTVATAGGAYTFDPDTNRPADLGNKVTYRVVQGPHVTEVHQIFDQWLSQVIRLYKNSQFIEFEWIIGPLPTGASTDVTTRYETSLDNDGVFFTDSNGMFTVVRRVNDSLDPASVASSYYPVVSWIYIKNHAEELQMTVIPDRPQGGTSFVQGTIELMLHRRYFIDDALGVEEPLNDRGVNDDGIIVKGRHRLHLGTPKEAADLMRRAALQEVYRPVYMFYPSPLPANARKQHSELRVPLPPGGHLMTLEGTQDNRTLIRIENIGRDLTINVSVTHLLHSFLLLDGRETALPAHRYRSEVQRRPWPQAGGEHAATPDESAYRMQQVHGNLLVSLQPGQIRTFLTTLKAFSVPSASRAGH